MPYFLNLIPVEKFLLVDLKFHLNQVRTLWDQKNQKEKKNQKDSLEVFLQMVLYSLNSLVTRCHVPR